MMMNIGKALVLLAVGWVDAGVAVTCEDQGFKTPNTTNSKCTNSAGGPQVDEGCDANNTICVGNSLSPPNFGSFGTCCVPCVNNVEGAGDVDKGCAANQFCNGPSDRAGPECLDIVCINDLGGTGQDEGCTDSASPICVVKDAVLPMPRRDEPGSKCVKCVDSKPDGSRDRGCKKATPNCINGTLCTV